jgi:hypothetical protein
LVTVENQKNDSTQKEVSNDLRSSQAQKQRSACRTDARINMDFDPESDSSKDEFEGQ